MVINYLLQELQGQIKLRARFIKKSGVLELTVDGERRRFNILSRQRAPYPGELNSLEAQRRALSLKDEPLLLAPYIAERTGQKLSERGWSWADGCGNWDIRASGVRLQRRVVSSPPKNEEPSLPSSGGGLAVVRWLIHLPDEAISATELAKRAAISQPRASQVLKELLELEVIVHPSRFKWEVKREALLERFLAEYPGPKGSAQYFYTLKSPNEVAVDLWPAIGRNSIALVSGDVGADLLTPHRRPSELLVYRLTPWLKLPRDWVEAAGPDDANIIVISPRDESLATLSSTREFMEKQIVIADPIQVLWDLHHAGGEDRFEAADVLQEWILNEQKL